ncbi:hypothetical protein [Amycolatopsis kentuckyensis]|uniref:hypothetical protein n=1 Tax=Amycolatopsis kentuckyensis TaxID=218823 RepID=UPI003561B377
MSRFADTYGEGHRLGAGGAPSAPVGAFLRHYHGREFGAVLESGQVLLWLRAAR